MAAIADLSTPPNDTRSNSASAAIYEDAKHSEVLSVLLFMTEAEKLDVQSGVGSLDVTNAMQLAHSVGKVVRYPEGRYNFSKISIATGGIVGEGPRTILTSSDKSGGDIITFTRTGSEADTTNQSVPVFKDFYLEVPYGQKLRGSGIKIASAKNTLPFASVDHVIIRNIPTSVYLNNVSSFTITNSNFFFYSVSGIYSDHPVSVDVGDNVISNCTFFNGGHKSGEAVTSYTGGMKFIANKVNGGSNGYHQLALPVYGTSILQIVGSSFENIAEHAVYLTRETGTGLFSHVIVNGNEFAGNSSDIVTDKSGAFSRFVISGNSFFNYMDKAKAMIDLPTGNGFVITGNILDGSAKRNVFAIDIGSASSNGKVGVNAFMNVPTGLRINNLSSTTLVTQ